jgi:DNA polymerase-1
MGQTLTREMDPAAFQEEYGFEPYKMVDLKALMGDPSDNIPGVPGVGEKTALELVRRYGTVEELYAALDTAELKPAVLRKLQEGRDMAELSYDLATIRRDAPIAFNPRAHLRRPPAAPALYELFLRLEFSKLIERLGLSAAPGEGSNGAAPKADCESELVTDPARAEALLETWEKADRVSCLTLPSLDGVAVCHKNCVYFLLSGRLGREGYDRFLKAFFSAKIKKVSHEVKDLMNRLLGEGLSTDGFVFDTALCAYLLAPTDGSYALEKLGLSYLNREFPTAADYEKEDAFGPLTDPAPALEALKIRTALVEALYGALAPRLKEMGMEKLYYEVELPLCPVLAEMERTGFLVDRAALAAFGEDLKKGIAEAQAAIYAMAGEEFNINSTQQMGAILFEKLGLPPVKKTKTGYSTNVEVLEKLRGLHPIVDSIMEYRTLTKLQSTYVEGLTRVIAPDGRIHTSFQNTATATGRLSSTEPNLQNIPVRTELGAQMRNMFVAAPGCLLVDADYSQIELRLLAHIAHDEAMIRAFRSGEDIHTVTASQVFGVPRAGDQGHALLVQGGNFGIVYGISDFSLSQNIGVSRRRRGRIWINILRSIAACAVIWTI